MADADPLLALSLAPGERVLWQGRPPLGAPWPGLAALLRAGLQGRFVLLLLLLAAAAIVVAWVAVWGHALTPWDAASATVFAVTSSALLGALIAVVLLVIAASKHVGPFYGSILALGLWGPAFAIFWTSLVAAHGWSDAVARLRTDDVVALFVLVCLPLARLALGVTRRLALVHVITDRRVAELRGARLLWERPRDDLRVERTWRSPGGHLVVGAGPARRTLHVRDDPARVLEDAQVVVAPPP